MMQRVNVDNDDSSSLSSLRLTLNLDDVPPTEETVPDIDGGFDGYDARHEQSSSAVAPEQQLHRLEVLLRSIRAPDVSKLVRVAADYEPQNGAKQQSEEIPLIKDQLIQVTVAAY